jgi:hypothetical protein
MAPKLKSLGGNAKNELPPPPQAFSDEAQEVLRAWVVDGGLHVSMMKSFDDPMVWGVLLADVARHAARIYAEEDGQTEEEVAARIASVFRAEISQPTDVGSTESIS